MRRYFRLSAWGYQNVSKKILLTVFLSCYIRVFRMILHTVVAGISRKPLLGTGIISEV